MAGLGMFTVSGLAQPALVATDAADYYKACCDVHMLQVLALHNSMDYS